MVAGVSKLRAIMVERRGGDSGSGGLPGDTSEDQNEHADDMVGLNIGTG